tara:strand:+ start:441 stop:590 length:150 start_codon:yes stop_codon:yes gene_type:complete
MSKEIINRGLVLGISMACVISWSMWKSFWWMLFHGVCGWGYLIYWGIKY